jgi:hypothetical protein
VPGALRAWQGAKLLAGRDGSTCSSEVGALHLLAVTEPGSELGFWSCRRPDPGARACTCDLE